MIPPLAISLAQQDEPNPWVRWVVVALFFGFPIVARLVRSLMEKAGLARPEPKERARETPERRREVRERQRESEDQGEELWRRLARGEIDSPPPAVPVFRPEARRAPEAEPEPGEGFETALPEASLELESEPQALSVLGEVSEPSDAPEVSLEQALEPASLAAFGVGGLAARPPDEALTARPRLAFRLTRGELRRAIVLSELLAPPLSQRR